MKFTQSLNGTIIDENHKPTESFVQQVDIGQKVPYISLLGNDNGFNTGFLPMPFLLFIARQ